MTLVAVVAAVGEPARRILQARRADPASVTCAGGRLLRERRADHQRAADERSPRIDPNSIRARMRPPLSSSPRSAPRSDVKYRRRSSRSRSFSRSGPYTGISDCLSSGDLGQVRLEVSLEALARVHDLDRELVLVLPDAANPLAVAGHQRHRLVSRPDDIARSANLAQQPGAGPRRSDPREIRTELPAASVDPCDSCCSSPGRCARRWRRRRSAPLRGPRSSVRM